MSRHNIPLGKILGIPIGLDYSWFLIFVLLTWSLAAGYYPAEFKNWWPATLLVHGRSDSCHAFRERADP